MSVGRYIWQPRPVPQLPAEPSPLLRGRRILVMAGATPAEREAVRGLRALLEQAGAQVSTALPAQGAPVPDGIIDLAPLTPLAELGAGDPARHWRTRFLETMAALRICTPAWSATDEPGRYFYLAVTSFDGELGHGAGGAAGQPYGGLWSGLAKTLHREAPNGDARVIDIAPQDLAGLPWLVLRELYRWGLFEIGHRGGRRVTLAPAPHEPGPADWSAPAGSVVLLSGGGRGIGALLAHALAERHRCRVVVTGRSPLPDPAEPWLALDDAGFALWSRQLWHSQEPAAARRTIRRLKDARELVQGFARARARGLAVEYAACDVRDRDQVRALVARFGGDLAGVIHNAGVDRAVRLTAKGEREITATIGTKIDGFVHLFEAVRDLPLRFFCNVGSLSGRMGGMVGQIDYAAANECLSWLGRWARSRAAFPVMTLCWPTWQRTGLVANYEAALRYMDALVPEDGVARWLAELDAGTDGEISYIGALGDQLTPALVGAFPTPPLLPGQQEALPVLLRLGAPEAYRHGELLCSRVRFDRDSVPALADTEVGAASALPVSLLLEDALCSSAWVLPAHAPRSARPVLEDVTVRVDRLTADGGEIQLLRDSRALRHGSGWAVDVEYRVSRADSSLPLARLRVVHPAEAEADTGPGAESGADAPAPQARLSMVRDDPAPPTPPAVPPDPARTSAGPPWRHRGLVFAPATWDADDPGRGEVAECRGNDVWALPVVGEPVLPLAALEALAERAHRDAGPGAATEVLSAARIEVQGPPGDRSRITSGGRPGAWRIASAADGRPVLDLQGLALTASQVSEAPGPLTQPAGGVTAPAVPVSAQPKGRTA